MKIDFSFDSKFYSQAGGHGHFLLTVVKGKEMVRPPFHGGRNVQQIAATASDGFAMRRPGFFGRPQHGHPVKGRMGDNGADAQIGLDLFQFRARLMRIDQLMKHGEAERIAHFQPVPGSKREGHAIVRHERGGEGRAFLLEVQRNDETGICVGFQNPPRISSNSPLIARSETTLAPKTFRKRAVISGILARAFLRGFAGTRRATVCRRLVIATSSPSATQARTRLKSCRTSRIDAVRMSHIMCHRGRPVNGLFSRRCTALLDADGRRLIFNP